MRMIEASRNLAENSIFKCPTAECLVPTYLGKYLGENVEPVTDLIFCNSRLNILQLAIINSSALNVGIHVSLSDLVSSVSMPRSGIAGLYGSSISRFFKESPHCSP